MDFVYICKPGDNEELRYSLRSILKNTVVHNVWLVGGKPDWYRGNFIEVQQHNNKFENTKNCLSTICNDERIADDFVLMNDDFFITRWMSEVPTYYNGFLKDKIEEHSRAYGSNQYSRILSRSLKALIESGIQDPLNYEVHTPMSFNKEQLSRVVGCSLAPRSFYGNYFNVGGTESKDVKIYKQNNTVPDIGLLSTEDNSFDIIRHTLKDMFPKPCQYELI